MGLGLGLVVWATAAVTTVTTVAAVPLFDNLGPRLHQTPPDQREALFQEVPISLRLTE